MPLAVHDAGSAVGQRTCQAARHVGGGSDVFLAGHGKRGASDIGRGVRQDRVALREQPVSRQEIRAVVAQQTLADGRHPLRTRGLEAGREPALQRAPGGGFHILGRGGGQAGRHGADFFRRALKHSA
ncbi:hypothetical protein G6F22_020223 [Rhizopus arrhizus]|nr:hypothetical protein G6F22_020223 [Rhizopus arrhizus]